MKKNSPDISRLAIISLMTALLCVISPFVIPVPFSPVPISLTQLPLFLSLYLLGWRGGTISYMLYLLIGMIGMPVFSGFSGGLGRIVGPTGGYLAGMLPMVILSGIIIEKTNGRRLPSIIGMLAGNILTCLLGTAWLCLQLNIGWKEGLLLGVVPYIPGDCLKIAAASMAGPYLKRIAAGFHRG